MKFLILLSFLFNACSLAPMSISNLGDNVIGSGDPEIDMQNPNIGIGKLSIEQKEKLYPYFNIKIDAVRVNDASVSFSRAEKIALLDALDKVRFVLNSPEFRQKLETRDPAPRGDYDEVGSTGVVMNYDEPVDPRRLADAARRFSYRLSIIKSTAVDTIADAAPVSYYPAYAWPHPLYRQVPHFYIIDLDNIEEMTGNVNLNPSFDYSTGSPYYTLSDMLLHEMLHNMGATHDQLPFYQLLSAVEASYRQAATDDFFSKYASKWEAFKGYYSEKYAHLL
ncbi:MAG: hypothetical protein ACRCY4_02950 [Brevinema sp.]